MSSAPNTDDPAAAAAAAAAGATAMANALRAFNTELWTMYAFGITFTGLRTYARITTAKFSGLDYDDYGVWVAILFFTTQYTLAYFAVNKGGGLANNSMSDEARASLDPNSVEYSHRLLGSKIQVAGWTSYFVLIFSLRICMLFFYGRLTNGLNRSYRIRIVLGHLIVIACLAGSILAMYTSCVPIHKYWQINPNPGNKCQGAVSLPIVWVALVASIICDLYLIMIPLPMLWGTTLKPIKKIASSFILGAGIFVLVCSILKTVFVMTDQRNGAQLAGSWGTRESFVSVMITNLPMVFPLLRSWLKPFFGSVLGSSTGKSRPLYPNSGTGFRTIGGSHGDGSHLRSRDSRTRRSAKDTSISLNDSEEHIMSSGGGNTIRMNVYGGQPDSPSGLPPKGIILTNEFQVTSDGASMRKE